MEEIEKNNFPPFWIVEANKDEDLPNSQKEKEGSGEKAEEDGKKKRKSQENDDTKGKGKKKKQKGEEAIQPLEDFSPPPSPSNSSGNLSSTAELNSQCEKYEILKQNYEKLRHNYLHLRRRYDLAGKNVETILEKSIPDFRRKEVEGARAREGMKKQRKGDDENWAMVFLKL